MLKRILFLVPNEKEHTKKTTGDQQISAEGYQLGVSDESLNDTGQLFNASEAQSSSPDRQISINDASSEKSPAEAAETESSEQLPLVDEGNDGNIPFEGTAASDENDDRDEVLNALQLDNSMQLISTMRQMKIIKKRVTMLEEKMDDQFSVLLERLEDIKGWIKN
eukprot:g5345.t1